MNKAIPKINTQLRSHTILVPEVYREATGVLINGKRIKSLVFSTDVMRMLLLRFILLHQQFKLQKQLFQLLKDLFLLVLVVEQLPVNVLNRLL